MRWCARTCVPWWSDYDGCQIMSHPLLSNEAIDFGKNMSKPWALSVLRYSTATTKRHHDSQRNKCFKRRGRALQHSISYLVSDNSQIQCFEVLCDLCHIMLLDERFLLEVAVLGVTLKYFIELGRYLQCFQDGESFTKQAFRSQKIEILPQQAEYFKWTWGLVGTQSQGKH